MVMGCQWYQNMDNFNGNMMGAYDGNMMVMGAYDGNVMVM